MSRSQDKNTISIQGGKKCHGCGKTMQRFKHSKQWLPLPGRSHYLYWDRCFSCKIMRNYVEAKVNSTSTATPKTYNINVESSSKDRTKFYQSLAWKKFRYQTLVRYGAACQCCGNRGKMRVDHIKPISKYWHLRLEPSNAQVLCNDCNWGKLNLDETDWR